MNRRLAFGGVALVLLVAATVAAVVWSLGSGSVADRSTLNGKIAFSALPSDAGRFAPPADLYVIDPDGSNAKQLARCSERNCILRSFAWSPDGSRLAFVRGSIGGRVLTADLALYVIGLDGRERRLEGCGKPKWPSCGDFFGSQLTWAPDGSRVVVPRVGSLYVFDVDRGVYRRLTPACGSRRCFDMHPAWSPDGSKIVFARMESPRFQSLYSVKPDGSGLTRLTNRPGHAANPTWSPDGHRIAFDATDTGESRIYVIGADGSDLTLLMSGPTSSGPGVPAWSPDGRQIVYLTTPREGETAGEFRAEIWVMKSDGTERRRLYRSDYGLGTWGRPVWSPDGEYIAFAVGLSGDPEDSTAYDPEDSGIYVVRADGTGLRRLTPAPTEAAWQPSP